MATTSCNRTHSGFFDLKHCYQRTSADNISRKFGQRSSPTKGLKDGIPDFYHIQLIGTARALRLVFAGVLAALKLIKVSGK